MEVQPIGEKQQRQLFSYLRRDAGRAKREFSLSINAWVMLISNCHYCGQPPYTIFKRFKNRIEVYTGIDRVDNEKGYIPDNVVPCCGVCNFMKGRLGLDVFLAQIKRIHANLAL